MTVYIDAKLYPENVVNVIRKKTDLFCSEIVLSDKSIPLKYNGKLYRYENSFALITDGENESEKLLYFMDKKEACLLINNIGISQDISQLEDAF